MSVEITAADIEHLLLAHALMVAIRERGFVSQRLMPKVVEAETAMLRIARAACGPMFELGDVKVEGNSVSFTATVSAPIQHATYCHATAPTADRPDGGCVCGARRQP